MKKLSPFFLTTLLMMSVPALADDQDQATVNQAILDQAAKDVCGCLAEPYAALEKALQAMKTEKGNDLSRLMQSKGELTQMISATETCMADLRKKYPGINADQSLQKQVLDRTRQFCPNPLETIDLSAPSK